MYGPDGMARTRKIGKHSVCIGTCQKMLNIEHDLFSYNNKKCYLRSVIILLQTIKTL